MLYRISLRSINRLISKVTVLFCARETDTDVLCNAQIRGERPFVIAGHSTHTRVI
jgi:hypothetical protein